MNQSLKITLLTFLVQPRKRSISGSTTASRHKVKRVPDTSWRHFKASYPGECDVRQKDSRSRGHSITLMSLYKVCAFQVPFLDQRFTCCWLERRERKENNRKNSGMAEAQLMETSRVDVSVLFCEFSSRYLCLSLSKIMMERFDILQTRASLQCLKK